jgi:hypothetical protein
MRRKASSKEPEPELTVEDDLEHDEYRAAFLLREMRGGASDFTSMRQMTGHADRDREQRNSVHACLSNAQGPFAFP